MPEMTTEELAVLANARISKLIKVLDTEPNLRAGYFRIDGELQIDHVMNSPSEPVPTAFDKACPGRVRGHAQWKNDSPIWNAALVAAADICVGGSQVWPSYVRARILALKEPTHCRKCGATVPNPLCRVCTEQPEPADGK